MKSDTTRGMNYRTLTKNQLFLLTTGALNIACPIAIISGRSLFEKRLGIIAMQTNLYWHLAHHDRDLATMA